MSDFEYSNPLNIHASIDPATGYFCTYWSNGAPHMSCIFDENGRIQGRQKVYNVNGTLNHVFFFKDGIIEGEAIHLIN